MANDDHFVEASPWASERFTCDYLDKDRCGQPIQHILVREGEPQAGYCHAHYLSAKATPKQSREQEKP